MEPKDKILLGANGLFMKYGFKSITMDDIARELGVSKKTLYQFFEDKNDLVNQTMKVEIEGDQDKISIITQKNLNAIDEIFEITQLVSDRIKHMHPSILFDMQKYYPEAWDIIDKHRRDFIVKTIKQNLIHGQEQGLYRKEINSTIVARLFSSTVDVLSDIDFFTDPSITQAMVYNENLNYHLHSITNATGKAYLENKLSLLNTPHYEK
jgi:AcrR family transcriptional regulator